tara:strand:+ start:560 stop:1354 length:795 start_codon:yes stop_codon:yes gene_type:complete
MFFLKIIGSILILYLAIICTIFISQRKLLYHPTENNYLDQLNLNHQIEKIVVNSDHKLEGWYYKKNKNFKTLLFFHGNAGKLDNRIYKLNEISKLDLNYLIVSYRGFNGNEGSPFENGLYKDANAAKAWLNKKNINNQDIILYGESLGTAVAVNLATNNDFAGIILESPFTSMIELAKKYYPYIPVKLLLKDKYDTIKKINLITCPILIMHGRKDDIVPFYMGVEIFDRANKPKSSYFNDYDDHMMDFNKDLINSINSFIKSLN